MIKKIKKINSSELEKIIKELDKIELEEKTTGFTNRRDVYICPECVYTGKKCCRCIG